MPNSLKVDTYKVLHDCVEAGISYGYRQAHKHNEKPSEDDIKHSVLHGVMLEISEYFKFDENEA